MRRSIILATCIASGSQLLLSTAARATDDAARSDEKLEEIVVTATHVQTNESKTPISMAVISQSELKIKGIRDVQTLVEQDPSLNFATGNGAGWITMRGVSGQGGGGPGAVGAAVPVAFDGFYYNLNYIFNNSLYDVRRIEVLRGPQGTLFGRNASGGLVNVVTNDPTSTFGGYGQLTYGNYNTINTEGGLNIPVSETLQLRFAFMTAQHDGYRKLAYGMGQAVDDADATSGRVKLAYEPSAQLRFLLSFQMTHLGGAGTTDNIYNLPADANLFPTHEAIPLTSSVAEVYNLAFPSQVHISDKLLQLHIDYSGLPAGLTLSYLGGYDQLQYVHTTPLTGLDSVVYGVPTTIELLTEQDPRTQNQELRLISAADQTITWQAGFYYYRSLMSSNDSHFRDTATPGAPDFVAFLYQNEQKSTAGYAQAEWHIGSNTVSAGVRYTADYVGQFDRQSPDDGIIPAQQATSYNKWTWHAGDAWNVTDKNLLYFKVDTGYRAGAFNLYVPFVPPGQPPQPSVVEPYKPEYVTAYELGTKNRFYDERLLWNADVFYMLYKDQQLQESNQGGVFTVNAKATNIYGLETQFAAIVNPIGRFDLSLTWLHARFESQVFTNALLQSYNIGGNQLMQAPSLSLVASYEHEFKVGSGTLTPRIDTKFQTGQYFDFYNFPDSYQSAYTRTDLHLIYAASGGKWSIDAFVRNIGNSIVIADESESFSPPLTQPGTYNVGFQSPRTYGVTLSGNF